MIETKPRLIVVAGPNGSGKTSITEQLLRHAWMSGCKYVNPDILARDLYGDWNSPEAILAAARKAEEIRTQCVRERRSLAFETVMSATDKLEFIQDAKRAGYFVRLFFIGTDHPSINAKRVAIRVMQGGHDVSIPKIISRYYRSLANCAIATGIADRLYLYDNSIDGAPARLLLRLSEGKIAKSYGALNQWAAEVVRDLMSD